MHLSGSYTGVQAAREELALRLAGAASAERDAHLRALVAAEVAGSLASIGAHGLQQPSSPPPPQARQPPRLPHGYARALQAPQSALRTVTATCCGQM